MKPFKYANPKEAVLSLVRIFGPCTFLDLCMEFRELLQGNQVDELPYKWLFLKKRYNKKDLQAYLDELWIAGEIVQIQSKWQAAIAEEKIA